MLGADDTFALAELDLPVGPIVDLRETVFRALFAASRGEAPQDSDLAAVAVAATEPLAHIAQREGRLSWQLDRANSVRQLRGILARDALALLASEGLRRIRVCDGGECGWLFLDESRADRVAGAR